MEWLLTNGIERLAIDNKKYSATIGKKRGPKLTQETVNEIRKRLLEGASITQIATRFDLTNSTVSRINRNRHWPDPGWTPIDLIGKKRGH